MGRVRGFVAGSHKDIGAGFTLNRSPSPRGRKHSRSTSALGALLPYGADRERRQRDGHGMQDFTLSSLRAKRSNPAFRAKATRAWSRPTGAMRPNDRPCTPAGAFHECGRRAAPGLDCFATLAMTASLGAGPASSISRQYRAASGCIELRPGLIHALAEIAIADRLRSDQVDRSPE